MATEQAGSNPSEKESYDGDLMADVRAAFTEEAKAPGPVIEKTAPEVKAEPDVKAEAKTDPEKVSTEAKADHPTDPARYADGTFKPTKTEAAPQTEQKAEVKAETVQQPVAQAVAQPAASAVAPPGGFSVKTKAEWDKI